MGSTILELLGAAALIVGLVVALGWLAGGLIALGLLLMAVGWYFGGDE